MWLVSSQALESFLLVGDIGSLIRNGGGRSGMVAHTFGRLRRADCSEDRNLRLAWATWWNPIRTQKKNEPSVVACTCSPSYSGGWVGRITWTQEVPSCSEPRSCPYSPAWATEWDSISKKKKLSKTMNMWSYSNICDVPPKCLCYSKYRKQNGEQMKQISCCDRAHILAGDTNNK